MPSNQRAPKLKGGDFHWRKLVSVILPSNKIAQ
jgi:hypothetical protein